MATQYFNTPAGTVSANYRVGPMHVVCAGPAVLGGTVKGEFSYDGVNWTLPPWLNDTQGGSFRPSVTGWIRITATTQAANTFIADLSLANTDTVDVLISTNAPLASPSTTSEVILASFRVPPNYLTPNFRLEIAGSVSLTNNVNVKTLKVEANGLGGTAFFTSPSLASQLNYNFMAAICGRGDGQSLIGTGAGASGGVGVSTTAYPTLTRDYLNQETEFVVTATKATAGDTFQLETLRVTLYT